MDRVYYSTRLLGFRFGRFSCSFFVGLAVASPVLAFLLGLCLVLSVCGSGFFSFLATTFRGASFVIFSYSLQ